jgi:hypothetical protein
MLAIAAKQLSLGHEGDDVGRVHTAIRALGRAIPPDELRGQVFGPSTAATVRALQAEIGVEATGVIDVRTVEAINEALKRASISERVVRGHVNDANGRPVTAGQVEAFVQQPRGEVSIGRTQLGSEGEYELQYRIPADYRRIADHRGHGDLRVAVFNAAGLPLETTPSSRSIIVAPGAIEVIDFVATPEDRDPKSEFELIKEDVEPLLGGRALADLLEQRGGHDVSLLATRSGYSIAQVSALVVAHRFERETGVAAAVYYALLRQGLPANLDALFATHPEQRAAALSAALAAHLVPAKLDGTPIEQLLSDVKPRATGAELEPLLGDRLSADLRAAFVSAYFEKADDPDAFWKAIATDRRFADSADSLKLAVQVGALTNHYVPLAKAVLARREIGQAKDLVRIPEAEWKSLVQTTGVPDGTPGETADEKAAVYAAKIVEQVEAAFPTAFFAARLGDTPVAKFLVEHDAYDLTSTYPEKFFVENPTISVAADLKRDLYAFQRLHRLTSRAVETIALQNKGFHSALQIARQHPDVFGQKVGDALSSERAQVVHANAVRTATIAMALLGENAAALNRTELAALPRLDVDTQARLAGTTIPNWETLFGTFDLCACTECSSADSAAAYFVDILQFLRERGVKDALFARRPDLGEIELSCENTNVAVPIIDLVTEILENAVSPPAAFTPLALSPARETDLAQPIASPALSAEFSPPLTQGARIEVLEEGKRWRVGDEAFAYSITKRSTGLEVETRSRQTSGSSAERRATPQYINRAAYDALAEAVYPWALPFDLPSTEARVFLQHLGVNRHELIEAFRPMPEPFDPNSAVVISMASERLGLTATQRKIIVGEPLTSPRTLVDFWGGATLVSLDTVRAVLDRSGLSFAELEAVLATGFINPARDVSIRAKTGEPVDTCDPTKLEIDQLTTSVLDRMHRFVRLQRVLGWSASDLDRAIAALATSPAELTNDLLVRLDQLQVIRARLRLPVQRALALWSAIDTTEPDSLYQQLFFNPVAYRPQDEVFRLRDDRNELVHADELIVDHAAVLQTAFRLDADSLALLVQPADRLTLANLSRIYRHALLARGLSITVADLLSAIALTHLSPFDPGKPDEALRFITVVAAIRAAGFSIQQLDYLLRHQAPAASSFAPVEADQLQTLDALRTQLTGAEETTPKETVVRDRMAVVLGISPELAKDVLARVKHGSATAEHHLLALAAVKETLTRVNALTQLEVLEKLQKVATIVKALDLPETQLAWLFRECPWLEHAPDVPGQAIPFSSWSALLDVAQLRRDLAVTPAALEATLGALTRVADAPDPELVTARNEFVAVLEQWLGWPSAELHALLGNATDINDRGLFDAHVPTDYHSTLLVRLARAMTALKRLDVTAATANAWCRDTLTASDARAIRSAAKAKHDDEAWLQVAPQLQDALRDAQRAALVSFLVANPQLWAGQGAPDADANDLFAHFLVDVEQSACQQTSRIKQAISSVQLFAQRALLGLEPGISTTDPTWAQWSWMQSFRVWEANRKIWLYPENYIEPDLRDDKTPLFRELESELLQSDLDDAAAETAVRHYLEKLDQLAQLDIVGTYQDEDGTVHVFGRTDHAPKKVFYRQRTGALWTPWEAVPFEIEGDHLIPVKWNRRLMLIWPHFEEKAFSKVPVNVPVGATVDEPPHFWEIRLAWSEYQDGTWSATRLTDPVRLIAYQDETDILFDEPTSARVLVDIPDIQVVGADHVSSRRVVANASTSYGFGFGGIPPYPSDGIMQPGPLVAKELFSFKALIQGEQLTVRGYLRRDYRGHFEATDPGIACVFGEFRFEGCRKIMSPAPRAQIATRELVLAPAGTKFDCMWFTRTSGSLTVFDGTFPSGNVFGVLDTVIARANKPGTIAGDPTKTLAQKFDIPVLGRAPTPFRLLAPHQDIQFVCDRPFFYVDRQRAFMVTSTGRTTSTGGFKDPRWNAGDVGAMYRMEFFPQTPQPEAEPPQAPLKLLVPNERGRRIEKELPAVDLQPFVPAKTLLPTFSTSRRYKFSSFSHPFVCRFVQTLDRDGIRGLLSLDTQTLADEQSFAAYEPRDKVEQPYPIDKVDFSSGGAFDVYNWELFFHIPLLIAERLRANQRFADARKWFHYVFDPTGSSTGDAPQRYWRMKPFHDRLDPGYAAEAVKTLEEMIASGPSDALLAAVATWRNNPFNPHAIARLRTTAYQKAVVMKYIDNLIDYGDQLFSRDTLETINEATQLYVLAAELLGRRPEVIDRHIRPPVATFNSLELTPGGLGNALEQLELFAATNDNAADPTQPDQPFDAPATTALAFCVPENATLLGYWGTVADRLFKIRHCMNIAGQVRQLPLFEPPIDPSLLVRARAAGLDISEIVSNALPSLPSYRFTTMLNRANELASEVKSLGSALLNLLEKRDVEALSTLRSRHEMRLLQAVRDIRRSQIDEAKANVAALKESRAVTDARKTFYESRERVNSAEGSALRDLLLSQALMLTIGAGHTAAAVLKAIGVFKFGWSDTGPETGAAYFGAAMESVAAGTETAAAFLNTSSQMTARRAEFARRADDWKLQGQLATIELKQIDQQLTANEIRLAIAEREVANHEEQIRQATELDEFLRRKFSSQDLYDLGVGQLSGVYFQTYQLACELAKRAEICMQHELGLKFGETQFISFGKWDTLHKGLWAGEHLAHDLKRLEVHYLDKNIRELELTKHVSLEALAPAELLKLRATGSCELQIPEWFFDMDTPGHYMRRIRSVSVTIPCVTGPFTTVHCKLQLLANSYRRNYTLVPQYERNEAAVADDRFIDDRRQIVNESIVTSSGQNDAGVFEVNLRDERYMPFEGAGAISKWKLQLPTDFKTFDYSTISDVVLHMRYTARDSDSDEVREKAMSSVKAFLGSDEPRLFRLISVRHDFPSEWQALVSRTASGTSSVTIDVSATRFPFFTFDRKITINAAIAQLAAGSGDVAIASGSNAPAPNAAPFHGSKPIGPWTIATDADPSALEDIFVTFAYSIK